jgi:dihydrofolate synthase/folylpolyglutamate synthase
LNYAESIDFLNSRIRFGMRPGTERVEAMMDALGDPQKTYPVLHVAGTNAKFSVVAIATSILTELGLTVGNTISPDLGNVRERVAFALEPISEDDFAERMTYLRPYVELVEQRVGSELTYFEIITVLAFEAFFDRAVHAAVIETGLGGEYDATNVADATVGVLTNVSLDHVRQFGGDLKKAAWEKAGIVKQGTTLVTGVEQDDLFDLIDHRAKEKGAAQVLRFGRDFDLVERTPALGGQAITVQTTRARYEEVFLALFGAHQASNATLAVTAVEEFIGQPIAEDALERGLASVKTPARMEIIRRHPLVIVDGGHNPAAARSVRAAVQESFTFGRVILVIGMVDTKPIDDVASTWAPIVDQAVVCAPKTDRAADASRVVDALTAAGLDRGNIDVIEDVPAAVEHAIGQATDEDLVMVFGSFYTASEARKVRL